MLGRESPLPMSESGFLEQFLETLSVGDEILHALLFVADGAAVVEYDLHMRFDAVVPSVSAAFQFSDDLSHMTVAFSWEAVELCLSIICEQGILDMDVDDMFLHR